MPRKSLLLLCLIAAALVLAACSAGSGGSGDSAAADTLETYLQALADKDEATLTSLTCEDWEMDALLELDAFQAVETELEGLDCQETGSEDGATLVTCQGNILATYSDEVQEFDLSERNYRMVQQGGDWLVCGY